MIITVDWLKKESACSKGVEWFRSRQFVTDKKIIEDLMDDDKFSWANWAIVRLMDHPQKIRYAIYAAEQVIDIFEKQYPDDKRPRKAIEAAKNVCSHDTPENRAAADAA